MINPLWLRTFCTLVEVGNFTRTATRLHMTQSGVSQHVHKLEQQLGAPLFVREGKQFSLTAAGTRLYDEAQAILLALANLQQRVTEDPPYQGVVRLMSPGSVGLKLYPPLLALQKQHPALVIDYRFAPNADIEKSVAESTADIGLMTRKPVRPDVTGHPIAEEPLWLVTSAEITEVDWPRLLQLGFINHPDGHHHAQLLLGANFAEFQHAEQFPVRGFSNQIGLILEPVSLGLGFTVLPAYAVEAFAKPELLRIHPLAIPVCETLYVCQHRQRQQPRRVQTVLDEVNQRL